MSGFGINLKFFKCSLQEIQSDSLEEIATQKAIQAHLLCSRPVMVEDDGLYVKSLKGFPGPYSSFVYDTIGNQGILNLLARQRGASFRSIIAFCAKKDDVTLFDASVHGKISKKPQGKRWGYDPIFIPQGQTLTYSKLKNKNVISHRYHALKKFASWYVRKQGSSGR